MSAGKNRAREGDTRVSLAHHVLSCAHHFKAPVTQVTVLSRSTIRNEWRTKRRTYMLILGLKGLTTFNDLAKSAGPVI